MATDDLKARLARTKTDQSSFGGVRAGAFHTMPVNPDGEAALAYIATLEAQLAAVSDAFAHALPVEIADDCGWSLSFCFGKRDKDRDRMHAASDLMRAIASGDYAKGQTDAQQGD